MENLVIRQSPSTMFGDFYKGRRVLVTGHTGFKGSWLCEWLLLLGAEVTGYALDPPTSPAIFDELGLAGRLQDRRGDVRDAGAVARTVAVTRPDVVLHLAAQPLVRASYEDPLTTYGTNVLGTADVLEGVRLAQRPCAVVIVTTDKCYHNFERPHGYAEDDRLGGHDPYSASKACAELVVASYQKSFGTSDGMTISSARAGNVIGGGDWAADRILPDCMRALSEGKSIAVRNPSQTRPWQHVLDPLSGYLWLAALLLQPGLAGATGAAPFCSAFNFGPRAEATRTVEDVVTEVLKHWPGAWSHVPQNGAPHEAGLLSLSVEKAERVLHWRPVWDFNTAVRETTRWYRRHFEQAGSEPAITREQILGYAEDARTLGLHWAKA